MTRILAHLRRWLFLLPLTAAGCLASPAAPPIPTKAGPDPVPPTKPKPKPPRPVAAKPPTRDAEGAVASRPIREPASTRPPLAGTEAKPALGLNLNSVNDWSTGWPFVDVFKASRPWTAGGPGTVEYDAAGNPLLKAGQSVQTLCCREVQGHYPAGKYVATWEGTGRVEIKRWDVKRVISEGKNRGEFEVEPGDGGIEVNVTESNPKDPVRNIRVLMPGFETAKSPFHPLFLERIGSARVLRFMDWQRTNDSPVVTREQRAKPTDARWSGGAGVPVEVMCELANTCGADPWFCVPHRADDESIRQFARLVKEKLSPDRKVYVEYSNEVWNWQFGQTKWAREQGLAAKLGDPEHARFYSERAVRTFALFEEEFGGTERLVRVLASQSAVPWLSEQIVTWKDAYKHADALAVAPYFGYEFGDPKNADETAKLTPEQLLDRLAREVDGPNREQIRGQAAVARRYGLRLVAYEGGQHLCGFGGSENNERLTKLFQAANRHPKMYDLYRKHLAHWQAEGGGTYVLFADVARPTKWGSWGLLEHQDQPTADAPKYRAFLDAMTGK